MKGSGGSAAPPAYQRNPGAGAPAPCCGRDVAQRCTCRLCCALWRALTQLLIDGKGMGSGDRCACNSLGPHLPYRGPGLPCPGAARHCQQGQRASSGRHKSTLQVPVEPARPAGRRGGSVGALTAQAASLPPPCWPLLPPAAALWPPEAYSQFAVHGVSHRKRRCRREGWKPRRMRRWLLVPVHPLSPPCFRPAGSECGSPGAPCLPPPRLSSYPRQKLIHSLQCMGRREAERCRGGLGSKLVRCVGIPTRPITHAAGRRSCPAAGTAMQSNASWRCTVP